MRCWNDLGGGRESVNEPFADGKVAKGGSNVLISTKGCCCRGVAWRGVDTGQGIHEQFFGPGFALVVEIYHLVTLSA